MKHFLISVAAVLFFVIPAGAYAEEIDSFLTEITVKKDSSLEVREVIEYDFQGEERHGIFRTIPLTHPQESSSFFTRRLIEVDVQDVMMDAAPVPYEITESGGELSIRIGDPDTYVGNVRAYTIEYTVRGAVTYIPNGGAELYWDVTGHDWPVKILKAEAVVRGEGNVLERGQACYTGRIGDTNSCRIRVTDDGAASFSETFLLPTMGLTVALELNRDGIEHVTIEKIPAHFLWLPILFIGVMMFVHILIRYKTAFRPNRAIVAQYEPYKDFKPMFSGVLIDGRLDPRDMTAGLLYLANEGYVSIKKTERKVLFFIEIDDYEITLKKSITELKSDFLRDLLTLVFELNDEVGRAVSLSSLRGDRSKQRENQLIIRQLNEDTHRDLKARGFIEYLVPKEAPFNSFRIALVIFFIGFVAVQALSMIGYLATQDTIWNIEAMLIILAMVAFGASFVFILVMFIFRRRTKKGYEAMYHLRGFKEFLSVTGKDRFKFHNAPDKNPEQFLEYLPYAVAFGVEKEWAKVFEGVTIPNPDWYDGGSVGAFSAVGIVSDFGVFSQSFSSSSSSSSASSGGGFSGGGAGGGGGGSW